MFYHSEIDQAVIQFKMTDDNVDYNGLIVATQLIAQQIVKSDNLIGKAVYDEIGFESYNINKKCCS